MIIKNIAKNRTFTNVVLNADYVVAGGGLTGVCSAIAAAREGLRVVLIQDRPVLGGNASSEVRLWALGATSHMGNNNRWSREGGIIDEILVENVYRNKEGNPVLFDMVLMDKVLTEKNITLLLNTTLYKVDKSNDRNISSVTAINSQNGTEYSISGQMFADCTGDGKKTELCMVKNLHQTSKSMENCSGTAYCSISRTLASRWNIPLQTLR